MPLEFAVFSPDAQSVVTVARDGLVQSWDAVAGKLTQTLVDEGGPGEHRGLGCRGCKKSWGEL